MSISVLRVTRLGISGAIWRPAGSFAGKIEGVVVSTKGGSATEDAKIRIQHRKMLRKQLHLKKQPVEFNILVQKDGEVEIDGILVPVELVGKIPTKIGTLPKLITKDEVIAEIALLSREREIKRFNQSVIKFQAEMREAALVKAEAIKAAAIAKAAAIKLAEELEEEMRQMEEELLVMLIASSLD